MVKKRKNTSDILRKPPHLSHIWLVRSISILYKIMKKNNTTPVPFLQKGIMKQDQNTLKYNIKTALLLHDYNLNILFSLRFLIE